MHNEKASHKVLHIYKLTITPYVHIYSKKTNNAFIFTIPKYGTPYTYSTGLGQLLVFETKLSHSVAISASINYLRGFKSLEHHTK